MSVEDPWTAWQCYSVGGLIAVAVLLSVAATVLGAGLTLLLVARHERRLRRGQGMVEYGLIIALITVIAVSGLLILGPSIGSLMASLAQTIHGGGVTP